MHELMAKLWPINRSLTGEGVRQTLRAISEVAKGLQVHEVASGTPIYDWVVPNEWNVTEAWIEGPGGQRVVDFARHNLHLMGYSVPVDRDMDLDELQRHLYSLPEQPDAIPYMTSYYSPNWGFCVTDRVRRSLPSGRYRVRIAATLGPGSLTFADVVIPGERREEILLSTYVCHPSLANNELSGPVVTAHLAEWIRSAPRRYTYRLVFVPETIGSLAYVHQHYDHLRRHVIAGFNVTCVGDERCYSYLPTRLGGTLSDDVVQHVLKHVAGEFTRYSYLDRGSDECQYCAPGIDLPVATLMRSKYGTYPEYHTSLDDLTLVTPAGLQGSFDALCRAIEVVEHNRVPRITVLGEPQLGKRGLYPSINQGDSYEGIRPMMDMIAYSDGRHSTLEIAERIGVPAWTLEPIFQRLAAHGLMEDLSDQAR